MTARSKDKSEREARERARTYQARVQMHEAGKHRRTRDNWIAGVVSGLIIFGAIGGQVAYYTVGPGTHAPEPTPSVTPTTTPSPTPDPSDSPAEVPTPSETPAP